MFEPDYTILTTFFPSHMYIVDHTKLQNLCPNPTTPFLLAFLSEVFFPILQESLLVSS